MLYDKYACEIKDGEGIVYGIMDKDARESIETIQEDISGKYSKPATGIPASDLEAGVIPDVSGYYTKPIGGIPETDLSGYNLVDTVTLSENANAWSPVFNKTANDAIFIIDFKGTSLNSTEKPSTIRLYDGSHIGYGINLTLQYSIRISGSIKYAVFAKHSPIAKAAIMFGGGDGLKDYALGLITEQSFTNVSGINISAPSGFYIGVGTTVSMYAKK